MLNMNAINHKNLFYPPGGILIWMIILIELITFAAATIVFSWKGNLYPEIYSASAQLLNENIAFINTLILLTSGFFIAEAVRFLKLGNRIKSYRFVWAAMILGVAFLIIKGMEYSDKIEQGYHLTYNTFFTFYWLLTGFHFLHVVLGLVILFILNIYIKKGSYH